jgi:putative membrane protein
MLWIKAFHIVFVVSWFAGLFYLPRIFVNLAMLESGNAPSAERTRLLLMARKLYRFTGPLMLLALLPGLWLWLGYGIGRGGGWMHVKLVLIVALIGYHHSMGRLLGRFERGENKRTDRWYRFYNEVPVLLLLAIVVLVVVKPF